MSSVYLKIPQNCINLFIAFYKCRSGYTQKQISIITPLIKKPHHVNPNDRHTTVESCLFHTSSHTVPQLPLQYTSNLPSYSVAPPTSRTGMSKYKHANKDLDTILLRRIYALTMSHYCTCSVNVEGILFFNCRLNNSGRYIHNTEIRVPVYNFP